MNPIDQSDLSVDKKGIGQDEPSQLRQWLFERFYQRILPLERQYIDLLHQQIALLNRYTLASELTQEQTSELLEWIKQLQRMINSHAFIQHVQELEQVNKALSDTELEASLWQLFGAASREKIDSNIDEFCHEREHKLAQIKTTLADITSLPLLLVYLKRRQKREKRTVDFVEEVHHDHLRPQ